MTVLYQPPDAAQWNEFFTALGIGQAEFTAAVNGLFRQEAPAQIVVRRLTPGLSGARVVVASFLDAHGRHGDWVIKITPPELLHLLQQEIDGIEAFARVIYPHIQVRTGLRCIAYHFAVGITDDFASAFARALTRDEVARLVQAAFAPPAEWYSRITHSPQGFFDLHVLNPDVQDRLRRIGREDLWEMWQELRRRWPVIKGVVTTLAHGDFNQSNILFQPDGRAVLIDFALTGEKHWAVDFARLERQIKFTLALCSEEMSRLCDSDFHFAVPAGENADNRVLTAVSRVREQARRYFETAVTQHAAANPLPDFTQEYFLAVAFQQLCLLGSAKWPKTPEQSARIADSTARILKTLLRGQPRDFFFGYFCREVEGQERILLQQDAGGKWLFPLCGFVPRQGVTAAEAAQQAVNAFIGRSDQLRSHILGAHFAPMELHELQIPDPDRCLIPHENRTWYIHPYFFKVRVETEFDPLDRNCFWTRKGLHFERVEREGEALACAQPELIQLVCHDFVVPEYGRRVLQCNDIIVFRDREGSQEFLMLHRRLPQENTGGWEYPKGGMEYHETTAEGAIRELLEETGVEHIGDFVFGGDLGFQTADVAWRRREYDTLRVHGSTYLFIGRDEDIRLSPEHDESRWMSWHEAHEKLWVGGYGRVFLERWEQNQMKILRRIARPVSIAFQVTEQCPVECRFCLRRRQTEETMESREIRQLIDMVKERGILRLTFTGGEPLRIGKEKLFEAIRYANGLHIHTCLSTTGIGLTKSDIVLLDSILDQLLLSLHTLSEETDRLMFRRPESGAAMRRQVENILQWVQGRHLIIEVSTVVCRANLAQIPEIGRWLFARHPHTFWRLEEYYANGEQSAAERQDLEIPDEEFQALVEHIHNDPFFQPHLKAHRIRPSSKSSRSEAPDIMITPQGNLVTSCDHRYEVKGEKISLLYWNFRNRRRWSEYRDAIREDWDW